MTFMIRKLTVLVAGLLAIGLFGTSARADLIITVAEDAGAPVTVVNVVGSPTSDLSGVSATVNTADYKISILGGESNQNSTSELLSSTTSITNETGSTGHVLHITITGTGYSAPTTPPSVTVLSHIGGTVAVETTPSTNSLSFQSIVPGAALPSQTPAINAIGSYSNDASATTNSLSAPFSIEETLSVTLNKLNDQINYSSSTTLSQVAVGVPEPSSMAIAGLGALGMIGYGIRRRKSA
jgi:hypothetical protein